MLSKLRFQNNENKPNTIVKAKTTLKACNYIFVNASRPLPACDFEAKASLNCNPDTDIQTVTRGMLKFQRDDSSSHIHMCNVTSL